MATPENMAAYREGMERALNQRQRGIITNDELMSRRIELMCEFGVTDGDLLELVGKYLDELFADESSPAVRTAACDTLDVLEELQELAR